MDRKGNDMSEIYAAISRTMKDIGAVGKTERNEQQRYMYRGIDAIMNALNPAMIKNGIFVVPEVLEQTREERTTAKGTLLIYSVVRVAYRFYASDGSYVEAVTMGEGMDSGDKATNKAMAAALKYACFQTFMIPTEELIDSEKDSPEPLPKAQDTVILVPADGTPMISEKQKKWISLAVRKHEKLGEYLQLCLADQGVGSVDQLTMRKASEVIGLLKEAADGSEGKTDAS